MESTIKVLLIEGNVRDSFLVSEAIAGVRGVRFDLFRRSSLRQGVERLEDGGIDVILVDLALPDSNGLDTLVAVRDQAAGIPIIVLSAFGDRALARKVVHEGAQDYLVIGRIDSDSLGRSIHYAIERKSVEGDLVRALHEAEEADRAKSEFLSNVSHEIRTPLTAMRNVLSNLNAGIGGKLKGKQKEYLSMLDEDCTRLCSLVEKLLNLSRLQAGKVPVDFGPTNLAAVAEDAVRGVRRAADAKDVVLRVESPFGLREIVADGSLLLQVFTNLVFNAIKFTPPGGMITVKLADRGDEIVAAVSDTGIGIAPENLVKVFEKFEQVNRKKGGAGAQGTGIGLALCKEIVALHGGRIWVESTVGEGSSFQFSLPKKKSSERTIAAEGPASRTEELLEV